MFKYQAEMLLNILTPERIQNLGDNKIIELRKLGEENNFYLISQYEIKAHPNNCYVKQHKEYANTRLQEVVRQHKFKYLSKDEITLLKSEIRFIEDQKIISLLKEHGITLDEIAELNQQITKFQQDEQEYEITLKQLEKMYDMNYEQVIKIIKELYPLLLDIDYPFNEEDKKVYTSAHHFSITLGFVGFQRKKSLAEVNNNPTIHKIGKFCKNYFALSSEHLYIFINKINELLVTNPELFKQLNKSQKTLKKV